MHFNLKYTAAALVLAMSLGACTTAGTGTGSAPEGSEELSAEETSDGMRSESSLKTDDYTLEKVVVLSRHNIRSPLSKDGSSLAEITPHEWFEWSSAPSELSLRGGVAETETGQYFRQWLEAEKLIPENYRPPKDEIRIYANAKQRTVATAKYFAAGMFPAKKNIQVETHAPYDEMDKVFNPQLTFVSDSYRKAAMKEIAQMGGKDGLDGIGEDLKDNYDILESVLDFTDSDAYKKGDIKEFKTDDTKITLNKNEEPSMTGTLKTATEASDALTLQFYEAEDETDAAFGDSLSYDDWKDIAEIKDVYQKTLFTAPLVAANVAHPLLAEIDKEIEAKGRKVSFLCGHDSNLSSVLTALDAEDYELPGAIEQTAPIGSKIVFEKWKGKDKKTYMSVELVYQNTDQLQELPFLSTEEPPNTVTLSFEGLKKNEDGLYTEKDMEKRLHDAIAEYDEIVKKYRK